jgi:hypothetical protein
MANTAAYSGLRWGELTALTVAQVDQAARVIAVDRKVVEVAGHLYADSHSSWDLATDNAGVGAIAVSTAMTPPGIARRRLRADLHCTKQHSGSEPS